MSATGRPRVVILEELPPDELLAWALEAELALDRISALAADESPKREARLLDIYALANPWSRGRALADAGKP